MNLINFIEIFLQTRAQWHLDPRGRQRRRRGQLPDHLHWTAIQTWIKFVRCQPQVPDFVPAPADPKRRGPRGRPAVTQRRPAAVQTRPVAAKSRRNGPVGRRLLQIRTTPGRTLEFNLNFNPLWAVRKTKVGLTKGKKFWRVWPRVMSEKKFFKKWQNRIRKNFSLNTIARIGTGIDIITMIR